VKYSGVTMIPEKDRSTTGASLLHVLDVLRLGDAVRQSQGKLFWATPFGSGKLPKDVGQYQLVFSHTVLEHVVDLPAFLVDVRQVLAPGGCFISYVDLTGHELGDHPLDFLGWPQKQWDELIAKTIAGGNYLPCRRERLPWYLQQIQAAGFKVETEIKTRLVVPERISQLFPGEDLTPEGVILYCDLA
jgi:SAM-dependent methyltransferase